MNTIIYLLISYLLFATYLYAPIELYPGSWKTWSISSEKITDYHHTVK